ncbi:MAG TPA: Fic family protein [Chloroflexota bacterium]|nr:Fic family protein [Chloroflexota bacterium]
MRAENARAAIAALPLPNGVSRELRDAAHKARLEAAKRLGGSDALNYAAGLACAGKAGACPDEQTIKELHRALGKDRPDSYRRSSTLIYNPAHTDLIYVPPEAAEVPRLMEDLLAWLSDSWEELPGIVLAGILLQALLLIQPFEGDNGHLARLAAETALLRKDYSFGGYAAPESEFAGHEEQYDQASQSTHTGVYSSQEDFTGWLEFFSGAVARAAVQAREQIQRRLEASQRPSDQTLPGSPAVLRERQVKALLHIHQQGAIRSGEYQRLAGIVPDTARRDFDELMGKGLIAVRGVGRGTHYVLTQRGAEEAEQRRA